jgi:hypothetical protein
MVDSGTTKGPLRRFEHAAAIAGLLFAVLMTASLLLFNTLPSPAAPGDLERWFVETATPRLRLVDFYLVPFAGVAFMWFMAAIRERGSLRTDRFFDTIFLISGAVFVATLFGGVAGTASLLEAPQIGAAFSPTEETIRSGRLMGFAFFNIYAARAAGVFTMVTAGMLLRSEPFPRWLGLVSIGIALVLLLGVAYSLWFIYLFPAWTALVSVTYLVVFRGRPAVAEGSDA